MFGIRIHEKMRDMEQDNGGFSIDKWYHFGAGVVIGLVAALLLWFLQGEMMLSLVAPVAAGLAKELWDKFVEKTAFDYLDFIFTVVGGFIGVWIFIWVVPV